MPASVNGRGGCPTAAFSAPRQRHAEFSIASSRTRNPVRNEDDMQHGFPKRLGSRTISPVHGWRWSAAVGGSRANSVDRTMDIERLQADGIH